MALGGLGRGAALAVDSPGPWGGPGARRSWPWAAVALGSFDLGDAGRRWAPGGSDARLAAGRL